ncbi:phosphotriesterase family protein [Lacrimispora indolis]|uniref:phosphotriesterase family protein n=1 Tax=Lacrimispora indolis TaxID=69825 RepID=UPI0004276587|nr:MULTISPECIES: phosphotriesterase [Lachnospiraceae]
MNFVRTIFGDISPEEMGVTYSHEHLLCVPPYWKEKNADDLLLDDPEKTKGDMQDFKDLGGCTIVDATAIDYGRNISGVAELAKELDIQIIATAGFNKSFLWDAKLPEHLIPIVGNYHTYQEWMEQATVDQLTDHVIREVEVGLEGTPYKAGQVKTGTGYNSINPLEVKTIVAIAAAHHETKAPVHLHTEAGTMALEQIEILEREKVDISRVSFGHMDRNLDLYYYEKILSHGGFLSFDGLGKIKYAPESARIHVILELCKRGYEDHLLISHDLARKSYYRNYSYGIGLKFILDKWVPRFIEEADTAGLDGRALADKFLINNPKECFTFRQEGGK